MVPHSSVTFVQIIHKTKSFSLVKRLVAIRASLEDCPSAPISHITVHFDHRWALFRFNHVKSTLCGTISENLSTVWKHKKKKKLISSNTDFFYVTEILIIYRHIVYLLCQKRCFHCEEVEAADWGPVNAESSPAA